MAKTFTEMLTTGGKTNSLGEVPAVIEIVLRHPLHLEELYKCLFDDNAWVRMRAADAIEKVCRQHPEWLKPYIDRFLDELSTNTQPSIRWHLAQIYGEVDLTDMQKHFAIHWLAQLLTTPDIDWIVASNAMETLVQFTRNGSFPVIEMIALLEVQKQHKSNAVKKRADKLLSELAV